jgi:hypothetical protein
LYYFYTSKASKLSIKEAQVARKKAEEEMGASAFAALKKRSRGRQDAQVLSLLALLVVVYLLY